jgi:hypothetical protein
MATTPIGAPPAAQDIGAPTISSGGGSLFSGVKIGGQSAYQTINVPGMGPVTTTANPDGTFTAVTGQYPGLQLGSDGTPNPQSLALMQSVEKAQAQPGGLAQQGFTYFVNPDGTLKITGPTTSPDGQPNLLVGAILQKNGMFTQADGKTPFPQGGVPGNPPQWSPRTPSGQPATDNPNFKGQDILTNGDNTGLLDQVPGFDTAKDAASKLLNGLENAAGPGAAIDTSGADAETARANALADALGGQANAAGAQADTDRGLGAQTREQQEQSIQGLTDAANGVVPSAAELQLKKQSGIDAARQYGLAAALQGNNPAAALRQASLGAAQVAGTTNQDAATLRANEQANARNALAATLGNVRSADQGAVNTDVNQQGTLTQGQLTSQGQGVTSTGQKLTAETEKEKADAARAGALIGAGGTAAATLLSDKRAKKDIVKASLADALGKGVHGVTFEYAVPEEDGTGPHFGVLAQELEKTVPGVVVKRPDGMRMVDTGHLSLANTAVLSELAARLMDIEKKQGARR